MESKKMNEKRLKTNNGQNKEFATKTIFNHLFNSPAPACCKIMKVDMLLFKLV
jgi:hypothetical protein